MKHADILIWCARKLLSHLYENLKAPVKALKNEKSSGFAYTPRNVQAIREDMSDVLDLTSLKIRKSCKLLVT